MQRCFALAVFFIGLTSLPNHALSEEVSADMKAVRDRYQNWVLGGDAASYEHPLAADRLKTVVSLAQKAMKQLKRMPLDEEQPALYNTEHTGSDEKEVYYLITFALPVLSTAYQLQGSDEMSNPWHRNPEVRGMLMKVFDRLDRRGFRHPMHLPWKSEQVKVRDPKQALVVDFILRTSGYALATFLLREELRESGRLERALATCWEIESHDEKTGDMRALYLQADAVRVVLNVSLPAALAEGNAARLKHLSAQMQRSMLPESNNFDTLKPDGLGHHHLAAYLGGYASFTMAQAAFAVWLLRDTEFACTPDTVANVAHGLEILRVVSNKYDMHKALGGRFPRACSIPEVMLGYTYLADLPHPRQAEFQGMFARLADEAFMATDEPRHALTGHRDEVSPGPGAIAHFMSTLKAAREVGAEADPVGHWSLNYGPMAVHRRDNWMVSMKGYSRYWWAFERSLVDARKDPRQENVFGFHDGSGSLMIFGQGKPWVTAEGSGFTPDGWDWCRMPGTTVRYFTAQQYLDIDKNGKEYNRPYGDSTFVGGVTLEGQQGLYVMDYMEAAPDERKKPLRALKSVFFFDDQMVVLGSGIRDGDGEHAVGTTLFQTALTDARTITYAQGESQTGLNDDERVFDGDSVQLVDAAGNGYYVPAGQRTVLKRSEQLSLNSSANKETRGAFATAWLDHGVAPENEGYEYVVLVRSGEKALAQFAEKAEQEYQVRRKDEVAHIVHHHRLGITGYAVAKAQTDVGDDFVQQASAACLVMARELGDGGLSVSVCNPDLGWEPGRQYLARGKMTLSEVRVEPMPPVPMPVTLTMNGSWELREVMPGVTATSDGQQTVVSIPCEDARSFGFKLQPKKP